MKIASAKNETLQQSIKKRKTPNRPIKKDLVEINVHVDESEIGTIYASYNNRRAGVIIILNT